MGPPSDMDSPWTVHGRIAVAVGHAVRFCGLWFLWYRD